MSHTTRPSAALTTHGSSAPMNPRSASSKSAVSSNGKLVTVMLAVPLISIAEVDQCEIRHDLQTFHIGASVVD